MFNLAKKMIDNFIENHFLGYQVQMAGKVSLLYRKTYSLAEVAFSLLVTGGFIEAECKLISSSPVAPETQSFHRKRHSGLKAYRDVDLLLR